MKIKDKLTLSFLLVGVLPLLTLSIFTTITAKKGLFKQSDEYMAGTVSIVSLLMIENTKLMYQASQTVSTDQSVYNILGSRRSFSPVELLAEERTLQKTLNNIRQQNAGIKSVFIISDSYPAIISGIPTTTEREYFREEFKNTDLYSSISSGPLSPVWITGHNNTYDRLYIFRRIQNMITGEQLGVLVFSIDQRIVAAIFDRAFSTTGAEVYLVDEKRNIISSYPFNKLGKSIETEFVNFTKDKKFISKEYVISKGWSIIIRMPVSYLLSGINYITRTVVIFCIFLIIIAVSLSFLVTNHLSHPILILLDAMKSSEIGVFTSVSEFRNDEFAQLIRGYNAMVNKLGKAFDALNQSLDEIARNKIEIEKHNLHLEELVSERTKELLQAEKMASLGNLVASVAHEINTPLGIAVTSVSFLDDNITNFRKKMDGRDVSYGDFDSFLKIASESTELSMNNLRKAANLIISFKRVAVDQSREDICRFNMLDNINDILISLKPKLSQGKHAVTVKCSEKLTIYSYPGIYYQIFSNFIINSLTHAFKDENIQGNMELSIRYDENLFYIDYNDNGCGMPPEILNKVFEPFFTTNRQGGGTGLGMHIVFNLVTQKLRGKIECESSQNRGTTFRIILPVDEVEPFDF